MSDHLYNLSFERSILSSIIFDPKQFDDLSSILHADDFYLPAHKDIYAAMLTLVKRDEPIDEEFIKQELGKSKKFDEHIMLEVMSANPIANIKAYVDVLKDKSLKRHLLTLTTEIKRVALEDDLPGESVIDLVEKKLYKITQSTQYNDFKTGQTAANLTRDFIREMKALGGSGLVGVDTGFSELNKMTTGFGKGDLVVIAARPSMGKTALVLNMVLNLLNKGKGVSFFSLEMPVQQLIVRLLSLKTSIPLQKIRTGDLDHLEQERIDDALLFIENSKLYTDDQGSVNINQLRSKLRKLKSKHPEIEVAVIDYLQIMSGTGGKDRHLEVGEISRGLKMLARELDMPIIALSQLNRSLEARTDKRPMLSDIRESGSIEQDADIIMFVYREEVYRSKEEKDKEKRAIAEGKEYKSLYVEKEEEEAEIIIGKQRNGPTGHVKLMFQKKLTRFVERQLYQIVYEYKHKEHSDKLEMPVL